MSFLETVSRAKAYLNEHGRLSVRALGRECAIEGDTLEDVIEELCDVLEVARRVGDRLEWLDGHRSTPAESEPRRRASAVPVEEDEAEHRQLTVLFCDLQGSTELAQALDAEEYRALLAAYYDEAKRVIDAYGGHVAQYMGDGLMVFFGYPQAHEDDPERAVRTGLEIIEALTERNRRLERQRGVRLAVRIGIHTGPVVVGELAGHGNDFAIGDTLNCAARVQGAAAPDTVLISETTHKRVGGIFVCEDLGMKELKGVDFPIRLHRPIRPAGVRSRFDTVRGRLTEFVGRGLEIATLTERWAEVENGHGQVVLISGAAGVGKSRLVILLQDILQEVPHTRLECHASLFTQAQPFHGVLDLLRSALRITSKMPGDKVLRRLERVAGELDIPVAEFVPPMAELLGVDQSQTDSTAPRSSAARQESALRALVTWTLALSRVQPVLILIEDLHWQDDATLELLRRLADAVAEAPVLLLLTARPEFREPWCEGECWTTLELEHLDAMQSRELIRAVSGGRTLDESTVQDILRRAEGVPLYIEELVRTALERENNGEVSIPDTLHDALMARLDDNSAPREIAQIAAVLGRQFHYELMKHVCDMDEEDLCDALNQLSESGVLIQLGSPPKASYLFKQALLRDAAYQSMVRSTRERRHRRVAEAILDRVPELAESEPELIARHFTEGNDARRAINFWKEAGERARERHAYEDALRHLNQALETIARIFDPDERRAREMEVQFRIAATLALLRGHSHEETGAACSRAQALAQEGGDEFHRALAELMVGEYSAAGGMLFAAMDSFQACLDAGRALENELLLIAGCKRRDRPISFWASSRKPMTASAKLSSGMIQTAMTSSPRGFPKTRGRTPCAGASGPRLSAAMSIAPANSPPARSTSARPPICRSPSARRSAGPP
jgi:class 3 adenylate cyclase/tetratricopeptide (TPR) repeat protein